jgi:hypothetical protein
MDADLKRLADAAESLESQARELRAEVEKLAQATRDRAAAEAERAAIEAPAPAPKAGTDDSEVRIVAFSMVLDGKPREEVASHLEQEFGLADSDALLNDLYARAAG